MTKSKPTTDRMIKVLDYIDAHSDDGLESAIRFLYAHWLPRSGKSVRDFPLFLQRLNFFPDVAENELVTDIYLPLQ